MTDQDSKSENNQRRFDPELLKKGLRCDLDQYEMLKRCSDKKDMAEWNEWRKNNPKQDVLLEGVDLSEFFLAGAYLYTGQPYTRTGESLLRLDGEVHLEEAILQKANLRGAYLYIAHLDGAKLEWADLEGAGMWRANLKGANLYKANLKGITAVRAVVDGGTDFWKCIVDEESRFDGVGLGVVRIEPRIKTILEYTIRRKYWEAWYKGYEEETWPPRLSMTQAERLKARMRECATFPVRLFWLISNYGLSTGRIIAVFLGLAIGFAIIYWLWGLVAPPGIVDYLFVDGNGVRVTGWLVPIRAVHFSVVIMTVGFTNMHANAHSLWAHILVGLQMILGFVLLGALVTRFAVLFTAGGPAGRFADEKEKKPQET